MGEYDWLSEPYDTDDWEELYKETYKYFLSELKNKDLYLGRKKIILNLRILEDWGKEEAYIHLITEDRVAGGIRIKGDRLVDLKRAKRIKWFKEIILNNNRVEILKWIEKPQKGENNYKKPHLYLWLKDKDYLIVLKDIGVCYFFKTGFYVKYKRKIQKLEEQYKKAFERGLQLLNP